LFHKISSLTGRDNVVSSPLSIATVLSILMMGSKGETHQQLWTGLMFDQLNDGDAPVHSSFREVSSRYYFFSLSL
ncbi:serpin family protein, partial [Campylobacter hyointestinalis]|uniref:serpin family protein n=1 Tax=Campylobacter hyointestinalis TaxID=198 RepID=UPI00112FCB8D